MGGADKVSLNLLRCLRDKNISFKIFYTNSSIPRAVQGFHPPGWNPPSREEQFKELGELIFINDAAEINKHGITVLHTHRSGEDVNLLPSLQHSTNNFKILETNFFGSTITRADLRVFVSATIARGRSPVIPNAIAISETSEDMRDELGLGNKFVYGKLSRPDNDIYSPISLEAYARVEDENTAFLYIGSNPKAIQLARELGLKSVIFMDPILDTKSISRAYNTMDLFCHSNGCGETFGNTIAEAFIHNRAVISHRGGADHWPQAHKELFGDRIDLYIEDRSIDSYANLMKKMRLENGFRISAAKYLKDRAEKLYNANVVTDQYISLYERLS
jgi:glycosyltransferase involved in cell wall biosynthesis